jgi:hypothetical protein
LVYGRWNVITEKFNSLSQKASVSKLDIRLNKLDRDISKYELQLVEKDGSIIDSFISPLRDVQRALGSKDALISTLISENRSYIWLVTKDGVYRNDSTLTSHQITLLTKQLLPKKVSNKEFSYNASNEYFSKVAKTLLNQTLTVRRSKNLILPLLKYSKC